MYESFEKLDGSHPWRKVSPDGYVDYRARIREGGRVLYFNFDLAREMKLVPANHAPRVTAALEKIILETFCLQIINEYDIAAGEKIAAASMKRGMYMATRYLQAQHKDKRGLTSGDGRAIWIGSVKAGRVTYDVSARGTGATCLSPGAQLADGPIKTGDDSWGYSCGTADIEELFGTVLMSEIFHRNGFPTERTLAVIGFDDGTAIGVRAGTNLLRPAHVFRFLKQGKHAETKAALDYFIDRQVSNGDWTLPAFCSDRERYRRALTQIARSYGRLAAVCEEEYIFNWLAWDGDNVLASGAILDYGSIRQFAAKHSKYRYDDTDRFSSTLIEQKFWAREMVKVFAQAFDFAITGEKTNLRQFRDDASLEQFDAFFEREREFRTLWKIGFTPAQIERLRQRGRSEIGDLRRALTFFEDLKVARGPEKLPDGITHKPIFLIRHLLRELPKFYADECDFTPGQFMEPRRFCEIMAASYASQRDLRLTDARVAHAKNFQQCYQRLAAAAGAYDEVLASLRERASVINYEHRITGNGVLDAVEKLIAMKEQLKRGDLQAAVDRFITSQILIPGVWQPLGDDEARKNRLLSAMQEQVESCNETV
jgi:hypothetical protein